MFNQEQFRDKVVFIVGAGSGMGKANASHFAALGATVVAGDVSDAIHDTFADIQKSTGAEGMSLKFNATNSQEVDQAVKAAVEKFGRINILVNCVGVIQVANEVELLPEEEWDRVLNINLKSHYLVSKAVIPVLKQQEGGRIVLITSIWGQEGQKYFAAYCASKGGLIMLTQSLAKELVEFGINVNSIAPGMINTELHQKSLRDQAVAEGKTYDEVRDQEWSKCPMGYAGDPMDISNGIVFLASQESRYMTGATLDVNGGIQMR